MTMEYPLARQGFSMAENFILKMLIMSGIVYFILSFFLKPLGNPQNWETLTGGYFGWIIFLWPFVILGIGILLFIFQIFRYIKTRSSETTPLKLRNIGFMMTAKWFLVILISAVFVQAGGYSGTCYSTIVSFGGGNSECSFVSFFLHFLTLQDPYFYTLFAFIGCGFIVMSVLMFLIGYFFDRKIRTS